jgi:hypothetical protein
MRRSGDWARFWAWRAVSSKRSVTLDKADTTTTGRRGRAWATSRATWRIAEAVPTEVPPNFITRQDAAIRGCS